MVDLNTLVSDNIDLAYQGFQAQGFAGEIDIQTSLDSNLSPVLVQSQDLARALLNLLNNACEAVAEKVGQAGYEPQIQISTSQKDAQAIIHIQDNGKGIPADIQAHLFDPFFTTKPTGKGNIGLGLSIAYDIIVKGHQGKIDVKSEVGKGTEFLISLPLNGSERV